MECSQGTLRNRSFFHDAKSTHHRRNTLKNPFHTRAMVAGGFNGAHKQNFKRTCVSFRNLRKTRWCLQKTRWHLQKTRYDPAFLIKTVETIVLQRDKPSDSALKELLWCVKVTHKWYDRRVVAAALPSGVFCDFTALLSCFYSTCGHDGDNSYRERALSRTIDKRQQDPQRNAVTFSI